MQAHSTVSDGQLEPAAVVEAAAKAGVATLALSDHDAVAGVPEAARAAEGLRLELVPGLEMSCVHEYADDLHVLGYWIDLDSMAPTCERAQQERVSRAGEIVERLRSFGSELTLEDAIAESGDALSVGRPHIARAAGTKPEQMNAFFAEYLVPGAKAFVARRWPTADQAVELIHEAGGAAVVAHPYWDVKDPGQVETLIGALEVEGVEAFYPDHDRTQTDHLLRICAERRLTPTGSSDYHGPTHKTFSRFGAYDTYGLGEPQVPAKP
ncbi:MAG: PHP domain-containing protein [Solirubrobacterales bacterium]